MTQLLSSSLKAFQKTAEDHPLWQHEFLVRCRSGQLTLVDIQVLVVQMYKFCQKFNRILAKILSCCPDENAQLIILDNLLDEMGNGDIHATHPELFRRFTRELGIDDNTLASLPTEPETHHLIETYFKIPHHYGYLAAIGAVCFASEGIVGALYSQIEKGIVGAGSFPKESLIFFDTHIHLDDNHAAHLAQLLDGQLVTKEQAHNVQRAILEALDARLEFFNGIQRKVSQYQNSRNLCLARA